MGLVQSDKVSMENLVTFLLTALCLFCQTSNGEVKAGEYKINIKDPYEQERNAFRIHNHPNYIPSTYENDIALIELGKGVKMGPYVRSICLPRANEILATSGHVVSVAGWGFTAKGSHSSVLLYSAFEIQTNKKCADTTDYHYNETVMFCAGQSKAGNDTCKGDSGGSTVRQVLRDGRRRWVTVGLVSWGEKCGIKGKYGYYTRMEPFVPWIQDKVDGSSLSCGDPGSIRNGRIIGSDFLVGFTVKYICNEGYQLRGRSKRRCRRNGKWTTAPTCLKVQCRNPGTPRYGLRRPRRNKYYFKDKVRFRCKTNYTIIGKAAMRCRSDGTWSGFKPACLAPCKDPGIPAGGVRLDHSFKHSQTVRFLCRKKNQPPSVSFLTCTNGKWNQNIPRCIADCDDPGTPTNGQRQGDDFTLNKRVYFTCNRGYMRVGPAYLQCQTNRRWSGKAPICQHLSCIRPKLPENAHIYGRGQLKERYGFDEVVMFQCKRGYSASGSPFIRCLANGWTKTNLRCPPKSCGDPGHPTNGRRQGNVFTFKSQVNFTCDRSGYELKGSVQRVCQEDGRWSGNKTTCERIVCTDLGILRNGVRRPEKMKYVYEDRIDFRCNTNHTLRGNAFIMCQSDRTWTGTVPYCLEGCSRPTIYPTNGGIYGLAKYYSHNASIRYYCGRGYNLFGQEYVKCLNGSWENRQPTCRRTCGDPGRPTSGNVRGSTYYEGREVSFYCYRGYDLIGSRTARCLPTGRWSQPRPVCKRGCYAPQFANSIPNPPLRRGQKSPHGTSITFTCRQQSYTLDGPSVIYCLDGRWNGRVPVCRASCSKPSNLPYGRISGQNYEHGQKVNFTCLGLYTLVGSSSITCNNGRWDYLNQRPSCKYPCPNPGIPRRGSRSGYDYRHGKRITYTCERGTQMIGELSATCNDGKWSNVRPSCLKICQDLGNIVNGYKTENRRVYLAGEKATYRCNRGYDLAGRAELSCDDDGRWDYEVPFCYIADPCAGFRCRRPFSRCVNQGGKPVCVCSKQPCPTSGRPFCASDGKTYNNPCAMRKAVCEKNATIRFAKRGICECNVTADVAFLVDSSGSVGRRNWERLLQFISTIISRLNVGPRGSHIALIRYSSNAEVDFTFRPIPGTTISAATYTQRVPRLRWQRGYTHIDKALVLADQRLFTPAGGMRTNVPKVALLITDGMQTRNRYPITPLATASGRLKAKGVRVYAMGIGSNIANKEMNDIASDPKYVYRTSSFRRLTEEIDGIVRSICEECNVIADVAFLVDSSGSVGRRNWERLLQFISTIISRLNVGPRGSHIALIRYSSNAEVDFTFRPIPGTTISAATYTQRVPRLRWQRGYTHIDKALVLADQRLFTPAGGMRTNVPKVALLITDGMQTRNRDTITPLATASGRLKAKGVRVYAMGIGSNIANKEMNDIASDPKYVYRTSSFRRLTPEIDGIVRSICEAF